MEENKILFMSSLLKEKNSEIMQENFELRQKSEKLRQDFDQLTLAHSKIKQEKVDLEQDFQKELERWEDTTNHLKQIINQSDAEKKALESELSKLKAVSERCNHHECMIVDLKYGLEKINEDRKIEKDAIKEQIEIILEELSQARHEKEEILSEKLMHENDVKRYRLTIASLESEIKMLKESMDGNRDDIFSWCSDRCNRRDLLRHKQNRVYGPQSTKSLKALVNKKPCHT